MSAVDGRTARAAEGVAQLVASRARLLSAADADRRRLQGRLHDGAQQRLTHAAIVLGLAREAVVPGSPAATLVDEALTQVEQASRELRDVVHALLPRSLAYGGLASGLRSLADDLAVPVRLTVRVRRLAPEVETAAYLVLAGALDVLARAGADRVDLDVVLETGHLATGRRETDHLETDRLVLDLLAVGTTVPEGPQEGLTGVRDRVLALGGLLALGRGSGGATLLHVELPVEPGPQPVR